MADEAFYFTYNNIIINIFVKQLINAFKQKIIKSGLANEKPNTLHNQIWVELR